MNNEMNKGKSFAISILSRDRPGIVESLSGAVFSLDGNIVSISQTVVRGYFTIILIADFPDQIEPDVLEAKLLHAGKQGEYSVIVREHEPGDNEASLESIEETQYILTSNGPDASGIICHITRFLAERSINIIDIAGKKDGDNLVLVAHLEVPHGAIIKQLQEEAAQLGRQYKQSVHIQHINIFLETNRI